jgi:dTDP-glucose 4,6-dehydratase
MHLFITGGAGFIGSHFVRMLLRMPGSQIQKVTVFDKFTYSGNKNNLLGFETDNRYSLVHGDICDFQLVQRELANHDVVIHFAAESHVDRSIASATPFFTTNVLGTQTLLEASRSSGISTFVHVSTDEVYGSKETGSWDENEPLLPNSPYAASKASSDLVARAYYQTYGMDVRVTRCSNNFGSHQFPEKMIPLFVTNLIDGKKVPLYGDGLNIRDWLHVEDHCRGIYLVIQKGLPGEIYNIGGGTELTNLELTGELLRLFDKDFDYVESVADRQGHDRRYSVDWSKIRHDLGYVPRHNLKEALPVIVDWYQKNEWWWRPLKG